MIISHKYKFICLNPPKTGSRTRVKILKNFADICNSNNSSHYNYDRMKSFCESANIEYYKYYIFTFVRNPWRRIESWYNMRVKYKGDVLSYLAFKNFVFNKEIKHKIAGLSQDTYFYGKNVNYVGSMETFEDDMKNIISDIGINMKIENIPYVGKALDSDKKIIKSLWTKDLIKHTHNMEINTINLKGYTFS